VTCSTTPLIAPPSSTKIRTMNVMRLPATPATRCHGVGERGRRRVINPSM
jgi:hypothetical protein